MDTYTNELSRATRERIAELEEELDLPIETLYWQSQVAKAEKALATAKERAISISIKLGEAVDEERCCKTWLTQRRERLAEHLRAQKEKGKNNE